MSSQEGLHLIWKQYADKAMERSSQTCNITDFAEHTVRCIPVPHSVLLSSHVHCTHWYLKVDTKSASEHIAAYLDQNASKFQSNDMWTNKSIARN